MKQASAKVSRYTASHEFVLHGCLVWPGEYLTFTAVPQVAQGEKEEQEVDLGEEALEPDVSLTKWALKYNQPEFWYLILGLLMAILDGMSELWACVELIQCSFLMLIALGLVWPAFSVLLSEMLGVLINPDGKSDVNKWSLAFVVLAISDFIANIGRFYCFGVAGEALTRRLRVKSFRAMVYKEADWFDQPHHRKNILTARLASDTSRVRGIVGERLGSGLCAMCFLFHACMTGS